MVAGNASLQDSLIPANYCLTNLKKQLVKFWKIEEVATDRLPSEKGKQCEAYFLENVSRDTDRRYTVRLPFRMTDRYLGELRATALKHLSSLEHKLS